MYTNTMTQGRQINTDIHTHALNIVSQTKQRTESKC